jgi:hypothetical protein
MEVNDAKVVARDFGLPEFEGSCFEERLKFVSDKLRIIMKTYRSDRHIRSLKVVRLLNDLLYRDIIGGFRGLSSSIDCLSVEIRFLHAIDWTYLVLNKKGG